jgi:phosphatidylinositol-4,5-bisphosphate 4-phosphatase
MSDDGEERRPLLAGTTNIDSTNISSPMNQRVSIGGIVDDDERMSTGGVVEDDPPPYERSAVGSTGGPTVVCRVCQATLNIEGKIHQHVVKCQQCGEATVS